MPQKVLDTVTGKVIYADSLPRTTVLFARAADGDQYRYQPTDLPVTEEPR